MGVSTGVEKKGFAAKALRGIGCGLLIAAMAACSTSSKSAAPVSVNQALQDYLNGNVSLAKSEFQAIVKADPTNKYGWYNLGVIAQNAGQTSSAAKDYLLAIKADPTFESPLYNLGVLRFQSNQIPDAINYLAKATVANPKDANAHWNLGLALIRPATKADNARATKELNLALKLNPALVKTLKLPAKKPAPTAGGTGPGGSGRAGSVAKKASTTTSKAP
jgi:tetratricopeptide (TPR) repeat protein